MNITNKKKSRPPIVTVMGHVNHGKTSILSALLNTNIVITELGGITQHIKTYSFCTEGKKITFIDTPGHEAFIKMRSMGARITDIVLLIIAIDDGLNTQTIEILQIIQNEKLPLIIAINKIDKFIQTNTILETKIKK